MQLAQDLFCSCPEHPLKPVEAYCLRERKALCVECLLLPRTADKQDSDVLSVQKAIESVRGRVGERARGLKGIKDRVEKRVKEVVDGCREEGCVGLGKLVKDFFAKVRAWLEEMEKAMGEEAERNRLERLKERERSETELNKMLVLISEKEFNLLSAELDLIG